MFFRTFKAEEDPLLLLHADPVGPDENEADSLEMEEELGILLVLDQLEEVAKHFISRYITSQVCRIHKYGKGMLSVFGNQ